ncbi:hypothetical protein ON010_g18587 [Phytophthora cinnamomi]|nr:hypothetical protein ON010_g18587 [Phytophthora cinnamomi]
MKSYGISDRECKIAIRAGVLDMLTVIKQEPVKPKCIAWVKSTIARECAAGGISLSSSPWAKFWRYFEKNLDRKISTSSLDYRTDSPGRAFPVPHPNLPDFVVGLEKLARRYAHLKYDIDIGRALAPKRLPIHLPTPVVLPDTTPNADVEIISAADSYEDSSDEEGDHTIRADHRNVIWRRLQRVTTGDLSHIQNLQGYYDEIG